MSVSDDEQTLQKLEEEKAAIQSRLHDGYTDAARSAQLESEIEAVEERIAREKQRAEYGEG
jgi:predicted  nucleic acid-binding Zn-ribbon protein